MARASEMAEIRLRCRSGVGPVKQGESRLYFSLVPLKAVDKGKDFCAFAL